MHCSGGVVKIVVYLSNCSETEGLGVAIECHDKVEGMEDRDLRSGGMGYNTGPLHVKGQRESIKNWTKTTTNQSILVWLKQKNWLELILPDTG